jgi:diacylglycerol kinase family enzyme
VGLFAETMFGIENGRHAHVERSEDPEEEISAALKVLLKKLSTFPSKDLTVRLDGRDLSGDYYMVEALNIRFIGPNLQLVPRATINDGLLDVVLVPKGDRAKLRQYLSDRIKRKRSRASLTVRQGRHLQVEWKGSPVHIDDKPWPEDDKSRSVLWNAIDIKTDPGALVFLTPE